MIYRAAAVIESRGVLVERLKSKPLQSESDSNLKMVAISALF
jgi:hypothetical protein